MESFNFMASGRQRRYGATQYCRRDQRGTFPRGSEESLPQAPEGK